MSSALTALSTSAVLADWWDPRTWLAGIAEFFHGAYDAAGSVVNLTGAVHTILKEFFRFFLDTGHFIADAVGWATDAWGQLTLPSGAVTVRDVVAALSVNHEPDRPVYASTPALACFPESRDSSEYSRTDITRFARYLRDRFALTIVDMSNRLPDPTAGPEAAVAAYWLQEADVLVLPTASSKQDFNGVLDYLELRDLPSVIVAYLVPRTRRNREHPLTRRYLAAIEQRSWRIVKLPDDAERVRYAGMQGVPVQAVSGSMRAAYRELAEAIAVAPKRGDR